MTHRTVRMSRLTLGLLAALAAAPAFAQSTSSGLSGMVTDGAGQPVAGADVVITHVESGTVSRSTTDASGRYNARGLRVGGPYSITVTKAGAGMDSEEGVFLELNQVSTVNAQLAAGDAVTLGAVTVSGSQLLDTFSSATGAWALRSAVASSSSPRRPAVRWTTSPASTRASR